MMEQQQLQQQQQYDVNVTFLLHGCMGEVDHVINYHEAIFFSIVLITMVIIAIYGNMLVIMAICKHKTLHTPRHMLLCSLAFIDLLSPVARVLPMAISTVKAHWIFGCTCCVTLSATGVFFCSASILHLCVITIERYLSIRYPLRSKSWITKRRLKFMLGFIWVLALCMAVLPYLTPSVSLYFNDKLLVCDFYLADHPQLSILMGTLYFCLPNILMIIVYRRIYRLTVVSNQTISTFQLQSSRHQADLNRRMKQEWRTVKMALVIIGMFFTLWLPYFGTACIKSYYPKLLPAWTERLAFTCAYLNSCCNFVVYSIMNRKLREAFKQLVPCCHGDTMSSLVTNIRQRSIRDSPTNEDLIVLYHGKNTAMLKTRVHEII